MKASDWMYVAEGGEHAVFAYLPHDKSRWEGSILRLSKTGFSIGKRCPTDNSDSRGIQHALGVLLAPYLDEPEVVCLSREFVSKLRSQTLAEGRVPPSRLKAWEQGNMDQYQTQTNDSIMATLHSNYRQPTSKNNATICVEIKPKAGYTSFSPLVHPLHRAKFRNTRFSILQQLHSNGYISKGWHEDKSTPLEQGSNYCPLDLFSGKCNPTQKALAEIIKTPQNNLKVWFNDDLILGIETKPSLSNAIYNAALRDVFGMNHADNEVSSNEEFISVLKQLLTQVLLSEPLLPKLLQLQRLDIVDADGAVMIYERLVQLCGSQLKAESRLDAHPCTDKKNCMDATHGDLLDTSPFVVPSPCVTLNRYCEEVQPFSILLQNHAPGTPPTELLNQARDRAVSLAQELSAEECLFLLRNWLLSLTMCDVSFFVTFQSTVHNSGTLPDVPSDLEQNSCRVVYNQGAEAPGMVLCRNESDSSEIHETVACLDYYVKLVDCDMKPARKLRNRAQQEDVIQNFCPEGR